MALIHGNCLALIAEILHRPHISCKKAQSSYEKLTFPISELQKQKFYSWEIKIGFQKIYVTMIDKAPFQDLYFSETAMMIKKCLWFNEDGRKIKYVMHPIA